MSYNEHSLKDALNQFIKVNKLDEKLNETGLKQKWEEIAGPLISKNTGRIYVKKKKLYLEITMPVIKQEILYNREVLLKKINEAIADGFVNELILL